MNKYKINNKVNNKNNIITNKNNINILKKEKNNKSKESTNKPQTKNNSKEEEEELFEEEKINQYLNKLKALEEQDISNIEFDEKEKQNENNKNNININNNDDNEESENSGVLAYDEVRDIIVYYDMEDIEKNKGYLFSDNDYNNFINFKKESYLKFFFEKNNANTEIIKSSDKKQKNLKNNMNKN